MHIKDSKQLLDICSTFKLASFTLSNDNNNLTLLQFFVNFNDPLKQLKLIKFLKIIINYLQLNAIYKKKMIRDLNRNRKYLLKSNNENVFLSMRKLKLIPHSWEMGLY